MATEYPIGRRYKITTVDNGKFPTFGNVSSSDVGSWHVTFVPDESFVGSIAFVGRPAGKDASDDGVGFASIPYRRVQVGGIASDNTLVTATNSTGLMAIVPADGMSVALLVEGTDGFGYLYSRPLVGSLNAFA